MNPAGRARKALVLTALLATGCVPAAYNGGPLPDGKFTVESDAYTKRVKVTGPDIGPGLDSLFLRAWKAPGDDKFVYQIYVADQLFDDWKFYRSAYDSDGNQFKFVPITRKVSGCGRGGCYLYEHVGLMVSEDYLRSHVSTGIDFKLIGKAGEQSFFIHPDYIKQFLDKIPQSK